MATSDNENCDVSPSKRDGADHVSTDVDKVSTQDWVNADAAKKRIRCLAWNPDKIYGISINPVTSAMTTTVLWLFVAICISSPEASRDVLVQAKNWITDAAAWLYIGTQSAWVIFIFVLYFSKYSKLKLGKDSDMPEYSNLTWFVMLFSCGVGNELLYFGVREPIDHYIGALPNRYSHLTENERAEFAITLVWHHFGMHGWVVFSIAAVCVGIMSYRKGLPLTMRSCFYPILGDKIFGIIGDMIDMMSAVCTLVGISTVLGVGVTDMCAGMTRLSGCPSLSRSECAATNGMCDWRNLGRCKSTCAYITTEVACTDMNTTHCEWKNAECFAPAIHSYGIPSTLEVQLLLIWIVTAMTTLSVITGIKKGIRTLSIVCFSNGMFLWLYVFLADNPWFFLDVFCQQLGLYVQWLFQLGFQTDAWARHTLTCIKVNTSDIVACSTESTSGEVAQGASAEWLGEWSMVYWSWWIAWAPFVGTFIARISRGRTIGELIVGSTIAPMLCGFMWFAVFGSSGIKMERFAQAVGLNATTSPSYVFFDSTTGMPMFENESPVTCDSVWDTTGDKECRYVARLSKMPPNSNWMEMVAQFGDNGSLMMVMSMVTITLYFVTSADSGCLVINSLCSNGDDGRVVIQKIYWAITTAAIATALTMVGYNGAAIVALQSVALCSALPYTILLCFMCSSIWKACQYEFDETMWSKLRFWRTDLTDFLDVRLNSTWLRRIARTCIGFAAPTYYTWASLVHLDMSLRSRTILIGFMTLCFYIFPVLWLCESRRKGIAYIGCFFFMCFVCLLTAVRQNLRIKRRIDGNLVEDFFACLFLFGPVADQLDEHFSLLDEDGSTDGDDTSVNAKPQTALLPTERMLSV